MEINDFKCNYYFFKPGEFENIYVFVDFGNVRPWAKEFWPEENKYKLCWEIDIEKLANLCEWVKPSKKFFYYGHYAKYPNLSKDHELNVKHGKSLYRVEKAEKAGFTKRTKEIKMVPHYDEDGKFLGKFPKCNFDVEITQDMLVKIHKYDTVMLFSGDSDFGGLLAYLKTKKKKIIVVSTRNRMSTELETVADKFIPAETLAQFLKFENQNTPPVKAEV